MTRSGAKKRRRIEKAVLFGVMYGAPSVTSVTREQADEILRTLFGENAGRKEETHGKKERS